MGNQGTASQIREGIGRQKEITRMEKHLVWSSIHMAQLTDSKDLDDGGKPGRLTREVKTYEREDRGRWSKRGRQNGGGH